jgi:hypothetical protein
VTEPRPVAPVAGRLAGRRGTAPRPPGVGSGMTIRSSCAFAALLAAGALAACSQPADAPANQAETAEAPAAETNTALVDAPAPATPAPSASASSSPVPAEGETVGGDGSEIRLLPLTEADLTATPLQGELACSFATGRDPLLLAKGDVKSKERSQGLVKIGDYAERVGAPGGYDAMLRGGSFGGRGTTVKIAVTGPATGGGESPGRPATLTFLRGDGASRTIRGTWTCGP